MSVLRGPYARWTWHGCVALASLAGTRAGAQQPRAVADAAVPARYADNLMTRPVTLSLENVSLSRAVAAIGASAKVKVYYRSNLLDAVDSPVSLHVRDVPLGAALQQVLTGTNLQAAVLGEGIVTIREIENARPANGVVTGRVINAKTKLPMAGVTITLDASNTGVVTAQDGTFRLQAAPGEHAVRARILGYLRQTKNVTIAENATATVEFALEPSASVLDEVVVTGTAIATERRAMATPITVITASDIEQRGITRIDQLFRGDVPGVIAMDQGVNAAYQDAGGMAATTVYARGATNYDGTANPMKTYVDGIEMVDPKYLGTIDPRTIERIEIVTGPQAATIYGSGAMGGVMQIFTKRGSAGAAPELTLNLKYGALENNFSTSRTPQHNHALNVTGSTGVDWNYSGQLTYNYTGQWQPGLYARTFGGSAGLVHARKTITITGTLNGIVGTNGVMGYRNDAIYMTTGMKNGEFLPEVDGGIQQGQVSTAASQTQGIQLDYRPTSWWQHNITVGRNENHFALQGQRPTFTYVNDTLVEYQTITQRGVSGAYNMSFRQTQAGPLAANLIVGATGKTADLLSMQGSKVTAKSQEWLTSGGGLFVNTSLDQSWGVFAQSNISLFGFLHMPLGIRFERSPGYGERHKVDVTPTNGLTFTIDRGDLSMKVLGSYGRATRAPDRLLKDAIMTNSPLTSPNRWLSQVENPDLRPENSSGPQGGIELYWGSRWSLTTNYSLQTVKDLIVYMPVDSLIVTTLSNGSTRTRWQYQYQNVGTMQTRGLDGTATLNLGPFGLRGTYTWNQTRALDVNPGISDSFWPTLPGVPTRNGSLRVSYARGGTSLGFFTTWTGQRLVRYGGGNPDADACAYASRARIKTYTDVSKCNRTAMAAQDAYAKADFVMLHRVARNVDVSLNMINVGNSYTSDNGITSPTLGRTTTFGVVIRHR